MTPQAPTTDGRRPPLRMPLALLTAFFLTGISSLVFEVVWTRLLLLSLGATPVVVSTVLGAFMGGMAIGSLAAGRPWLRRLDPVVVYAVLEGFAGVYAWASPWVLSWVEVVSPTTGSLLAAVLLLPATIAMGASLPILSRALHAGTDAPAARVGQLYAVNTAGACLGPVLAIFLLFPAVGVSRSLWLAGGLNLVVAGLLLLMRSSLRADVTPLRIPVPAERGALDRLDPLVVATLAVSGGAAMVYEVAWSRTLSAVFGSSAYGITIMLSVFLVGIAAGSAAAAAWLRGRRSTVAPGALAWVVIGASEAAFLSLIVARRLPVAFLALHESLGAGGWTPFLTQSSCRRC